MAPIHQPNTCVTPMLSGDEAEGPHFRVALAISLSFRCLSALKQIRNENGER